MRLWVIQFDFGNWLWTLLGRDALADARGLLVDDEVGC